MVNKWSQNQRAPASLRRTHRSLAVNEVLMTGGISRTGLAEELGMSQMAMSRIVRDLFDAGLVEEYGVEVRESGPGRRQRMLRIRPDGAYSAGIVLSAYSNEICIVKANGDVLVSRIIPVKKITDSEAAVRKLAKALNKLIDENDIPRQRIVGVGVAVAAQLDPTNQSVVSSYLLGWESFDLVEQVSNITGLPAYAETIANALTLAEVTVGTIKKKENVIVVRSATTIAASVLIHGQLVRGQAHQAGRIGHFRTKKTKLRCSCGSNSCLNCCASGWSVLARLGKTSNNEYHPDDVAAYAKEINQLIENQACSKAGQTKDANQARILKDAGAAIGRSLEQLNQFLEPQVIIVYGSMSRLVDYRDGISQLLCSDSEGKATLAKIRYGEISAVRAAGILALKESIYSPTLDFEQACETASIASLGTAAGNN
jgi:predicted NBD/HSP70 family sugar kinase